MQRVATALRSLTRPFGRGGRLTYTERLHTGNGCRRCPIPNFAPLAQWDCRVHQPGKDARRFARPSRPPMLRGGGPSYRLHQRQTAVWPSSGCHDGAALLSLHQNGRTVQPPTDRITMHCIAPPYRTLLRRWRLKTDEACADVAVVQRAAFSIRARHRRGKVGEWDGDDDRSADADAHADDVSATVTSGTLFSTLARLFPCSAAYATWRQNLTARVRAGVEDVSARTAADAPGRFCLRNDTEGYDWRRLFLVRYELPPPTTSPSLRSAFKTSLPSSPCAACDAGSHTETPAEGGGAAHQLGDTREEGGAVAFHAHTPLHNFTDEGRAVRLWVRCAFSNGPSTADDAETFFCWSRGATYALYYAAPIISDSQHSLSGVPPAAAPCVQPTAEGGAIRAAWSTAADQESGRWAAPHVAVGPGVMRDCLFRVGELRAIPGLPQPAAITLRPLPLTPFPHRGSSCGVAPTLRTDAATHDTAAAAALTGSVCSLHDYYTHMCGDGSRRRAAKRHAEFARGGASSMQHTAAAAARCEYPLPCRSRGEQARAAAPDTVTPSLVDAVSAAPSARFAFPVFLGHEATSRSTPRHSSGDRWATPTVEGKEKQEPAVRWPTAQACGGASRDDCFIPQPTRPHRVFFGSFTQRHWNCVPSADFLREFLCFHSLNGVAADAQTTEDESGDGFPCSEGGDLLSIAERVVRDYGVGVLLVHTHEWVYFTLLLHTHRAWRVDAAEVGAALGHQCDTRSATLSHHYCFPHPPCRLSTAEMEALLCAEPAEGPQRADAAQRVTLPRTWLVHQSTDVQMEGLIEAWWGRSGLGEAAGQHENAATQSGEGGTLGRGAVTAAEAYAEAGTKSAVVGNGSLSPISHSCDTADDDGEGYDGDGGLLMGHDEVLLHDAGLCGDGRPGHNVTYIHAALQRKRQQHAFEVELLCRYLHHVSPPRTDSTARRDGAHLKEGRPPPPMLQWAASDGGRSESTQSTSLDSFRDPRRCVAVSPLPRGTGLLKNPAWFAKPAVLAEEMRYGIVVKYQRAALAVRRERPLSDL
jgi:hypothetical protein